MYFSYWERRTFLGDPDVLIIGAGIVGLTTAIFLKRSSPALRIVVMEEHPVSGGASSRNAGFACFGSAGELLDDMKVRPEGEVIALAARRFRGLHALRELTGDTSLGYEPVGGFEVFRKGEAEWLSECLDALPRLNRLLSDVLGEQPYEPFHERLFDGASGIIRNRMEGAVDTGKMVDALQHMARSSGVRILHGIRVRDWKPTGDGVEVDMGGEWIKTRRMVVCTNGFARALIPELAVQPARNQVIVTSPISGLRLQGTFHMDRGYVYFREVHGRLLIGGFRNLEREAEFTSAPGLTPGIQHALEDLLQTFILPGKGVNIEYRWSGIMGLGESKEPIIREVVPGVYCGVRLGGMGVAIGTLVGQDLASLVLSSQ